MWCLCSAAGRKTPRPHPPSAPLTGSQALRTPACAPRATAHGWQHQRPATSTKKKTKRTILSPPPSQRNVPSDQRQYEVPFPPLGTSRGTAASPRTRPGTAPEPRTSASSHAQPVRRVRSWMDEEGLGGARGQGIVEERGPTSCAGVGDGESRWLRTTSAPKPKPIHRGRYDSSRPGIPAPDGSAV